MSTETKDPKELDPQDGGFGDGDTEKNPHPSFGGGDEDKWKDPLPGQGSNGPDQKPKN